LTEYKYSVILISLNINKIGASMKDVNRRKVVIEQPPRTSVAIMNIVAMYSRKVDSFVTTKGSISRKTMKKIIPDVVKHVEILFPELQTI